MSNMRNVTLSFFIFNQDIYIYIVASGAQLSVPAHELKDPLACGDRPTEAGTVDGRWLLTTDDSSLLLSVKMLRRTSKNHALYLKTISSVPFTRESQVVRRFDQYFYHISCRMSTGEHTFVRIVRFNIFIIIEVEPFYLQNFTTSNKQQCTGAPRSTLHHHALAPSPTRLPSRATNHHNHDHHQHQRNYYHNHHHNHHDNHHLNHHHNHHHNHRHQ